jgi:hypothetical protein
VLATLLDGATVATDAIQSPATLAEAPADPRQRGRVSRVPARNTSKSSSSDAATSYGHHVALPDRRPRRLRPQCGQILYGLVAVSMANLQLRAHRAGGQMTGARRSLQDLIRSRQQSGFIGRREQLIQYQENLALSLDDERRRFLFNIHGNAGVGKTYLTKQLQKIAKCVNG